MPARKSKKKTARKTGLAHEEIVRVFARKLRELRKARGLKQQELARRAGVNVFYVGRLERAASAPGIDLAARLAGALKVPLSELLPAAAPDPLPLLQEQARRRFESIMKRSGPPALSMLVPWLVLLDDALAKKR